MSNIYKQASRLQLRFASNKGALTVEDLWRLTLRELDSVGMPIVETLEKTTTRSLLDNPDASKSQEEDLNRLRLDIVQDIIQTKQAENRDARAAALAKEQRTLIASILEKKKLGELEGQSIEELEARLRELSPDPR